MTVMYVSPFWSYRPVDGLYVFKNWLTNRIVTAPPMMLDSLEAIYTGAKPPSLGDLAWGEDFRILFASIPDAEEYFQAIEDGWRTKFPVVDQIELTNRCPYSCKMCPRTEQMNRPLGDMSLDLLESIVKQISGHQEYVALHHFGESLVYPKLPSAILLASRQGVRTGISCNPPSLVPALASRLLESGISNIVLSLDSLDSEIYKEIRGSAAQLQAADANIRELVRRRDAGNYSTCITLQMINMHANRAEADRFLEYCADVGVDRGVVIRLGRWDFDDNYLQVLGQFTTPGHTGYCTRPWNSIVVLWDGRVVPCCHDYNGFTVLGDLRSQTISEVWLSSAAEQFRLRNQNYQLCTQCAFSRWFREKQRKAEGFRRFHHDRTGGARQEWINPASVGCRDPRALFDGFDIQSVEAL